MSVETDPVPVESLVARGLLGRNALTPKKNIKSEAMRLEAIERARRQYAANSDGISDYLERLKKRQGIRGWLGMLEEYGEKAEGVDPFVLSDWIKHRVQILESRSLSKPEVVKELQSATNASERRTIRLRLATPAWADFEKIAEIYELRDQLSLESGIPHHVDHIYPLAGATVCGLHVHWNLRAIPARDNLRKGAKVLH